MADPQPVPNPQPGGQPLSTPPQRGVGDLVKEAVEKMEQAREQAQQVILRAREDAERKSREAEREKQAISQAEQQLGVSQRPVVMSQATQGDSSNRVEQVSSANEERTDNASSAGAGKGKEQKKPNEPNWIVVAILGSVVLIAIVIAILAVTKPSAILVDDLKKVVDGISGTLKEPLEKLGKASDKISAAAEKVSADVAEIKGAIGTDSSVTPPTPMPAKSLRQLALEGIRNAQALSGKIDRMEKKLLSTPEPATKPSPSEPSAPVTDTEGKKN